MLIFILSPIGAGSMQLCETHATHSSCTFLHYCSLRSSTPELIPFFSGRFSAGLEGSSGCSGSLWTSALQTWRDSGSSSESALSSSAVGEGQQAEALRGNKRAWLDSGGSQAAECYPGAAALLAARVFPRLFLRFLLTFTVVDEAELEIHLCVQAGAENRPNSFTKIEKVDLFLGKNSRKHCKWIQLQNYTGLKKMGGKKKSLFMYESEMISHKGDSS